MSIPKRQEVSRFTSRRLALGAVALSFHRYWLGCKRAAGDGVFLLDGGSQEGQRLLLRAVAPFLLLQLHPQLLHLPLLLLEFPGELVDHLLLLHQHLVLLGVQPVQLGGQSARSQQAFVGAHVHWGWVQAKGGRRVMEGVGQGPRRRQVGRGGRDRGAGAGAAQVVEAVRQTTGGRGGLVTGQRAGGCDGESDSSYIAEVGHRVPRAVLEGPQPVHKGRLRAGHRQTPYSKLLS